MSSGTRKFAPGLHCRNVGKGQRVLLLHCSAGTGAQWGELSEELAGSFRVLAPDLHGYGTSTLHQRMPLSLTGHAMLLARLLEDDSEPVHLVGHSFGGAVALRLAMLLGAQVRSLSLIEPVAFQYLRGGNGPDAASYSAVRTLAEDMRGRVDAGQPQAAMRRFMDYWNGEGSFDALIPRQRDALAAQARQVIDDFAAIDSESPQADLQSSIQAPTLLLQGGRSPMAALLTTRRVAAAIPNAQRVRIRDAGHMAPVTHSEMVNVLIKAHLQFAEERAHRQGVATVRRTARLSSVDQYRARAA
jgi:pimeloyl-ACP methyl ester carboxylesterase